MLRAKSLKGLIFIAALTLALPASLLAHGGVNDDELIIRLTESGFEPKELTVVEGDEVLFINNDDVDRWPASNFHPTHELYPEFDSMRGVKPGQSWKMKFENVGTWRMHDHLFPHMTGTIVVLEDLDKKATSTGTAVLSQNDLPGGMGLWAKIKAFFSKLFSPSVKGASAIDSQRLAEFKTLNEKGKYDWLKSIASEKSPEVAWQYVLAAYDTPQGVVGSPHDMAHLVGQLLFKEQGFEGVSTCTPVFAFGCYHGLMEVAFNGNGIATYRQNILKGKEGCSILGNEMDPTYWSCIHGMGHGIITYREHDTALALDDCDLVGNAVSTYCYDGIFMELSTSAVPSFYRESDPLYPCNAIAEKYRTACARAQSRVMRTNFGLDTREIADICEKSGSETIRYHCIDSMGYLMGQNSLGDPEKVVRGCGEITGERNRSQCLAAAAGELVFQNMAGWQSSTQKICDTLSGTRKNECLDRVARIKQSYGR
jgi:plastocyanin